MQIPSLLTLEQQKYEPKSSTTIQILVSKKNERGWKQRIDLPWGRIQNQSHYSIEDLTRSRFPWSPLHYVFPWRPSISPLYVANLRSSLFHSDSWPIWTKTNRAFHNSASEEYFQRQWIGYQERWEGQFPDTYSGFEASKLDLGELTMKPLVRNQNAFKARHLHRS